MGREQVRTLAVRLGADPRLVALVFGSVDSTGELDGPELDGERREWRGLFEALSNEATFQHVGTPSVRRGQSRAGARPGRCGRREDFLERTLARDTGW